MLDVTERDLDDLADAEDRAVTLAFLEGQRHWPHFTVLTVKRWSEEGTALEVGYVRRPPSWEPPDPVVFTDEGPVKLRRYFNYEQLLDAGWRVD